MRVACTVTKDSIGPDQRKGQAVEKDKQAESIYPAFRQRAGKMGENRKAERSEPIYK